MARRKNRFGMVIGALILLCMGGFLLWSICRTWSSRSQLKSRCSYKTTAIVDDRIRQRKGYYRADLVYEYNGTSYSSFSESHRLDSVYSPGEQVKIYIDPDSPNVIYCPDDTFSLVLLSGIIAFFALMPISLACFIIKVAFLKKEENMNTAE